MNPYNQGFGQTGLAQQPSPMGYTQQPYGQQQQFGSMPQAQMGMPGMTSGQQMYPQQGMSYGQNMAYYPQWMQQTTYSAPQNQLQQWFQTADVNKDGSINLLELESALGYSGQHFSHGCCRAMMEMFDVDRNGQLNFQEFLALYNYILQMKQAYDQFNRGGNGLTLVDAQSAVGTHRSLGSMSGISQLIPSLFPLFDKTGSGRLDMNGFLKMACYLGKIMTNYERMGVMGAVGTAVGGSTMGGMGHSGMGQSAMGGMPGMGMSGMMPGMHQGMNQGMGMSGMMPQMGMGMNQMGSGMMSGYPSGGMMGGQPGMMGGQSGMMGGQPDIMSIGSSVINQLMGNKSKKDKKGKKEKK